MITLVKTSCGCPEQYDAFLGNEQVGYLRLRHGRFTVECPDVGHTTVYEAKPEGDGAFERTERRKYLSKAVNAIMTWKTGDIHVNVEYQIVDDV